MTLTSRYLRDIRARYKANVATLQERYRPFWLRHRYTARVTRCLVEVSIILAPPVPFIADLWFRSSQGPTDGQMLLFVGSILGSCTIAFVIAEVHSLITVDDGDIE